MKTSLNRRWVCRYFIAYGRAVAVFRPIAARGEARSKKKPRPEDRGFLKHRLSG
jgi:hypothetical protein